MPIEVVLTPQRRIRTPSGGIRFVDGTAKRVQRLRLVEFNQQVGQALIRAADGTERTIEYQLVGEWNADIENNDRFEYDGDQCIVVQMMHFNGYERRAYVARTDVYPE